MDQKIFINRKIQNDIFHMADVEIIIPFHGEQTRVTKLLEGVFRTVFTNRYLITLVDDCSPNASFIEKIKSAKIPGTRCFRLSEHKGFGAAVNHALNNPWKFDNKPSKKIPYVCIMQSDCCPEDNQWLSELGSTLERLKSDGIKMVSPMTNNPMSNLNILCAKKGQKREDQILTDGFLPMYCTLCNRELFSRIGLFKELPYAGVEVQDFALRMQAKGFKQAVSGNSWIHHDGGGTLNNFVSDKKVCKILRKVEEEFFTDKKVEAATIHTDKVN